MVSVARLEKIEIIRSQEFMPSEARQKFLKKLIILGPKTAILGPQFCRILVLGPHFWWLGGGLGPWGPPGSAPVIVDSFLINSCVLLKFNFTKLTTKQTKHARFTLDGNCVSCTITTKSSPHRKCF